jgi:hypothetical protein
MRRTTCIAIAFLSILVTGVSTRGQQVTIGPDQQYVNLEILKISTLAQELNDAGRQGFRLKMSAVGEARVAALMERADPPDTFEYRIVSTFSSKTGDKEVNGAAMEGFRVVPHTFMVKKGITVFNIDNVVIMERGSKRPRTYEYRTIGAVKTSNLDKDLKSALSEGWVVFDMVYGQILMERPKS